MMAGKEKILASVTTVFFEFKITLNFRKPLIQGYSFRNIDRKLKERALK